MMAYELENITILNVKDVDYKYVIQNMARNDVIIGQIIMMLMLINTKLNVKHH